MEIYSDLQSMPKNSIQIFENGVLSLEQAKLYLQWKNKLDEFNQHSPSESEYIEYARQIKQGRGKRYLKKLTEVIETDKIRHGMPKSILPKWALDILKIIFGYKVLKNNDSILETLLYISVALTSTVVFSVFAIVIKIAS